MPETMTSPEQVKVFILFLLEKIGYPLDYNDLTSIVIRDGYVEYIDFVSCFHELIDDGHIEIAEKDENDTCTSEKYVVSDTGRTIAHTLADDLLLSAVREKSYVSAMRHLSLEKREAVWNHSIEPLGNGQYMFRCSIKDCEGQAFDLSLRADSFVQVSRMRMNFEDKPDVVWRGIIALVTGNVNYLLDK